MLELLGVEAWKNLEQNQRSRWKNVVARATQPSVLAHTENRIGIRADDQVFCIGSCFAKNIEAELVKAGIRVLSHPKFAPSDGSPFEPLPHIYNVCSILNEFRWGLTESNVVPESLLIDEGGGRLFDPTSTDGLFGGAIAVASARRAGVTANMKRLRECRIVIITLGLIEVWFDTKTSMYINPTPPRSIVEREPNRFVFRVLDYNDCMSALAEVNELLRTHGHTDSKLFLSVSPVPLGATFTDQDVLVANTYSKSTQVAAVQDFCRRNAEVYYVPSYESVVNSTRQFAWKADLRHVTSEMVGDITRLFLKNQSVEIEPLKDDPSTLQSDWPYGVSELEVATGVPSFFSAVPGDDHFPAGFPKITTSSVLAPLYDGTCLMSPSKRIWHAQRSPKYPESISCRFEKALYVRRLFIQSQDSHPERAPTHIEVEAMLDGVWTPILTKTKIEWRFGGQWQGWAIERPLSSEMYRVQILANNGDPDLLTVQHLYLSPI